MSWNDFQRRFVRWVHEIPARKAIIMVNADRTIDSSNLELLTKADDILEHNTTMHTVALL